MVPSLAAINRLKLCICCKSSALACGNTRTKTLDSLTQISWLTFLGQAEDSFLWSIDLFRCESLSLGTHWVLVVMDQFTRRIIGFGIHRGTVDGPSLCRMFRRAMEGQSLPQYLSMDHDPLYRFP